MKVIYEKHPVSPERKSELRAEDYKILDIQFAPASTLKKDGPTVAEFVAAGYLASNYPPEGYESRSTDDEIANAVAEQACAEGESPAKPAKADKKASTQQAGPDAE